MAKTKTIYSIKGIFTDLFEDSQKDVFLIPTYQRGYKWASSGENSQVEVLMIDLFTAFSKGRDNRYYLQFITLKENGKEFEVIDGQQRLTTITILFSVLNYEEIGNQEYFVENKLKYKVRDNFITQFIYQNIGLILQSENWEIFLEQNHNSANDIDNQDVFFIYHATRFIHQYLTNKIVWNAINQFYQYLCNQVFLIVNILGEDMNSEKIFINVNKGVKLRDEDLVKALLITKIPLENNNRQYRMTENEINEMRSNIGRQWDELTNWASRENIKDYFKKNSNDSNNILGWLIRLSFPIKDKQGDPYPLFNYINNSLRENETTASDVFFKIREAMLVLDDWYSQPEISNLLGYVLHSSLSVDIQSLWQEMGNGKTTTEILNILKTKVKDLIPFDSVSQQLKELNYERHRQELFKLFLLLDVSKFLPVNNQSTVKYNFQKISSGNWSIEHIFPQNAREFKNVGTLGKEDLDLLKELLPNNSVDLGIENIEGKNAILELYIKIRNANQTCVIEPAEREHLYFLVEKKARDLHRLGNLALLQQEMNSSLSNHFFDGKRKLIVNKVSNGEFVPFHTYDVFSKLIISSNTGLHVWSKSDIHSHETYITNEVQKIINYLK